MACIDKFSKLKLYSSASDTSPSFELHQKESGLDNQELHIRSAGLMKFFTSGNTTTPIMTLDMNNSTVILNAPLTVK